MTFLHEDYSLLIYLFLRSPDIQPRLMVRGYYIILHRVIPNHRLDHARKLEFLPGAHLKIGPMWLSPTSPLPIISLQPVCTIEETGRERSEGKRGHKTLMLRSRSVLVEKKVKLQQTRSSRLITTPPDL